MKKLLSAFIVLAISTIVCGGASYIIYSSIDDKYSNYKVASTLTVEGKRSLSQLASKLLPVEAYGEQSAPQMHIAAKPIEALPASLAPCIPPAETEDSLITYLEKHGAPTTFSDRKILAQRYGITDYRGTSAQNITLLGLLLTANDAGPCGQSP